MLNVNNEYYKGAPGCQISELQHFDVMDVKH